MPQRSIRFPDELHDAIEAEAERRGRPHTFSSVLVEWASGRALESVSGKVGADAPGREPTLAPGSVEPAAPASTRTSGPSGNANGHRVNCKCAVCKPPKATA